MANTKTQSLELPYVAGEADLARRFYGGLLGLKEIVDEDEANVDGPSFDLEGITLRLVEVAGAQTFSGVLRLAVTDLAGAVERLRVRGYVHHAGASSESATRAFDPFGNTIELHQRFDRHALYLGWAA